MRIERLPARPWALPLLARRYHAIWGASVGRSEEDERMRWPDALADVGLPFVPVATRGETLLGGLQVRCREPAEPSAVQTWLSDVYVTSEARGEGVSARLIEQAVATAREEGVQTLHLQTLRPAGGLHARLGGVFVEGAEGPHGKVWIMKRECR